MAVPSPGGPRFAKRTSLLGMFSGGGPACGTLGQGEGDRSSNFVFDSWERLLKRKTSHGS